MNEPIREEEARPAAESKSVVAQATMRFRSESECERVIRLAHREGLASATAYRGPEDGVPSIFVIFIDEAVRMERFLPDLQHAAPGVPISVVREEVVHVVPSDFLRGGERGPEPFKVEVRHLGWVFAGGALGAGARLLVQSWAHHVSPLHATFPWGTMAANVLGSFGIAIFGTLLFERFLEERDRMFWVLGFLGSLTTFSTFALQTTQSWGSSALLGSLYGGGTLLLGLAAALLGIRLTRNFLEW